MRHIPWIVVFILMMAVVARPENTKPNNYDAEMNLDDFLDEYYKEDKIAKRGGLQTTEKRNRKIGRKLVTPSILVSNCLVKSPTKSPISNDHFFCFK